MDNTITQLRTPPGNGAPVVPEQDVPPLNERSTRRPPAIDRLSAVPSTRMVRDPNINIDLPHQEETRPKRASSIGASIRRLFSKSPSHAERSSSETTKVSPLGHETSESAKLAGQRGRTPPKLTSSANTSGDSDISSTLPPNNRFFDTTLKQNRHKGGGLFSIYRPRSHGLTSRLRFWATRWNLEGASYYRNPRCLDECAAHVLGAAARCRCHRRSVETIFADF